MPTERFKSKEAQRKNLAYRHIHGIPYRAEYAVVAGKRHKVKHSKKRKALDRRPARKRKPYRKHHRSR
jgi:hypothetical protein